MKWPLIISAVLVMSSCGGRPCFDEKIGEVFVCSCERRCNFVDDTFGAPDACAPNVAIAQSNAAQKCSASCNPGATCASCTCASNGTACLQKMCLSGR